MKKQESVVKFYRGNKRVSSEYPFMIVVGDTTYQDRPFGEYFILTGLPNRPLLCRRMAYLPSNASLEYFDWEKYPEVFSASAMADSEFNYAIAAFENVVFEISKELHTQVFWTGKNFEFQPIEDHKELFRWTLAGKFKKELPILGQSRNKKVKEIWNQIKGLPEIKLEPDAIKLET